MRKVAEHKVQRRTVAVNMWVRKPPDNAYFQCHHDPTQRIDASLLFDKEEQDIYFVAPNHPLVVSRLRRVTLATTYLWPSGQILLWPVPFPTGKGSVKCWKTARRAFEIPSGLATDLDPPGPRGQMVAKHPELKQIQQLRDQIAELRLGAFVNTIGADGYSRCPIMPWWTRTGRNQPSGKGLAYLLSLPAWVHGVICPPEGYGIACLDWVAQEFGLGAGLSGDPAMIADFQSGDPHLGPAIRAGFAPEGATKASHGAIRKTIKPVSLGIPYGITEYGVARQTGKSRRWSREVLAAVRHKIPSLSLCLYFSLFVSPYKRRQHNPARHRYGPLTACSSDRRTVNREF